MSSMGDIAFLLLIFFIVATTITEDSNVKWTPPKARNLTDPAKALVTVAVEAEIEIWVDQYKIPEGDLKILRSTLVDRIGEPEDAEEDVPRLVRVIIDASAPYHKFEPVMAIISELGARMVLVGEDGDPPAM